MKKSVGILLASLALVIGGALNAHPHVFVTTKMVLHMDSARNVTGVTMRMTYDGFFSLLVFEDMGLDPDADGVLTQPELDKLMGFDLVEWPEGFEGDFYVTSEGRKIEMPRPMPTDIDVVDGQIVSEQRRDIPAVAAHGLRVRQYDPTFYVAYDVRDGVTMDGPCTPTVIAANVEAAAAEAERLMEEAQSQDIFMEVELGHLYADEIVISCD